MITCERPTTIGQKLTNYKHFGLSKTKKRIEGASGLWKHCVLCGSHGKRNKFMVTCVSHIQRKTKLSPETKPTDLYDMLSTICWLNQCLLIGWMKFLQGWMKEETWTSG